MYIKKGGKNGGKVEEDHVVARINECNMSVSERFVETKLGHTFGSWDTSNVQTLTHETFTNEIINIIRSNLTYHLWFLFPSSEGDYYKATSQSKVFQVIYRQLLYIQLLQKIDQLYPTPEDSVWRKEFQVLETLHASLRKVCFRSLIWSCGYFLWCVFCW